MCWWSGQLSIQFANYVLAAACKGKGGLLNSLDDKWTRGESAEDLLAQGEVAQVGLMPRREASLTVYFALNKE